MRRVIINIPPTTIAATTPALIVSDDELSCSPKDELGGLSPDCEGGERDVSRDGGDSELFLPSGGGDKTGCKVEPLGGGGEFVRGGFEPGLFGGGE